MHQQCDLIQIVNDRWVTQSLKDYTMKCLKTVLSSVRTLDVSHSGRLQNNDHQKSAIETNYVIKWMGLNLKVFSGLGYSDVA